MNEKQIDISCNMCLDYPIKEFLKKCKQCLIGNPTIIKNVICKTVNDFFGLTEIEKLKNKMR